MLDLRFVSVLLIATTAAAAPRENVAYHVAPPLGNSSLVKAFVIPPRCRLPLAEGHGEAADTRFHFNEYSECESFAYKGEGGNENHFASKAECLATCTEDPCASGALLAADGARVECAINPADRLDSCPLGAFCSHPHNICCQMGTNNTDFCSLPKDEGRADVVSKMHLPATNVFYNTKTDECEAFQYKGLGGNKNRFLSMKACIQACKKNVCPDNRRAFASTHGPVVCAKNSECPQEFVCTNQLCCPESRKLPVERDAAHARGGMASAAGRHSTVAVALVMLAAVLGGF